MRPILRLLLPATLIGSLAAQQGQELSVPVARPREIVLDGRLDSAEWAGATVRAIDGVTAHLQHDGRHLYIAIVGPRFGFNSLCTVRGDSVRILHASAALGAVTYARQGDAWTSRDTAFTYGMRDTATTPAARAERAEYLAAHGWVANTVRMGGGLAQEFQIVLDRLGDPPRLALGRFVPVTGASPEIARWPTTVDSTDGCVAPRLVSGYVPTPLSFDPRRWVTLRLQR